MLFRGIVQLAEQWSPKPCVVGSSPTTPAIFLNSNIIYVQTIQSLTGMGSCELFLIYIQAQFL